MLSTVCVAGAPNWAWLVNQTELTWAQKAEIQLMKKVIPALDWSGAEVAFQDFWQNKQVSGKGLQVHYLQAVVQMVNATMRRKAVIGYELMNEPLPGLDINLWHFGSHYLYPFYTKMIQALTGVRDQLPTCECNVTQSLGIECAAGVDPISTHCAYPAILQTDKLMVFEPMALRNQLDVSLQWSRPFTEYQNIVYAPHSYSRSFTIWKKEPFWLAMASATLEATAMHAAVMVTEWGGGSITNQAAIGAEQQHYLVSGMAWCWKQNGGGGWSMHSAVDGTNFTINKARLAAVVKIYPRNTAGSLIAYKHDDASFSMSAHCSVARAGVFTEVYFPSQYAECSQTLQVNGTGHLQAFRNQSDSSVVALIACKLEGEFGATATCS